MTPLDELLLEVASPLIDSEDFRNRYWEAYGQTSDGELAERCSQAAATLTDEKLADAAFSAASCLAPDQRTEILALLGSGRAVDTSRWSGSLLIANLVPSRRSGVRKLTGNASLPGA